MSLRILASATLFAGDCGLVLAGVFSACVMLVIVEKKAIATNKNIAVFFVARGRSAFVRGAQRGDDKRRGRGRGPRNTINIEITPLKKKLFILNLFVSGF